MEKVAPILAPDKDLMLKHLDMLFGRALKGRVEITAIHTDKAAHNRPKTRFFDVDDLETAADYAQGVNSQPGWNVYVGAALRNEDVFVGQAADDTDFFRAYAVWADADDGEQTEHSRTVYREKGIAPPFVVVTGRQPSKRAQLWWPLDNPIEDIAVLRSTLRGIAGALKTDPKVCTGKQLMRLGGGVNWPKKEDRVLERTEIVIVRGAAWEFTVEQVHRAFPPMERAELSGAVPDVEVAHGGALGLEEKVMDGREGYAFKLVTAHLHEWVGTTGCEPTPEELYRSVWPVYAQKTDQVRAGRGATFVMQKCVERIQAFRDGAIPFMRSLDEAVVSYADRRPAPAVEPAGQSLAPVDSQGQDEPKPFRLTDWTAHAYRGEAKPIEWLCEGTVPLGIPMLFASMGGLGKSFMALDLGLKVAVDIVSGIAPRPILGGLVVQHGTVVILSAEDSQDSIHRRLDQIDPERRRDRNPDKLIIVPLPDAGGPRPLIASDGKALSTTPLFHDLTRQLSEIKDLRAVIIDPLQAFVLADINADPAAGQFMWSAFAAICATTGATLIAAHHMRKEGSASIGSAEQAREAIRGSTALVDGARLTYALWKASGEDGRDMCARLDVEHSPERIAFGAVVKANDQADRSIQTYVRQPSGLLVDQTDKIANTRPATGVTPQLAHDIVSEIGKAFADAGAGRGEGYAMSPQSGDRQAWKLIQRRAGCGAKEARELAAAWVANGILEMQVYDAKRHKTALRQVGNLG